HCMSSGRGALVILLVGLAALGPTQSSSARRPARFLAAGDLVRDQVIVRAAPSKRARVRRVLHQFRKDFRLQIVLAVRQVPGPRRRAVGEAEPAGPAERWPGLGPESCRRDPSGLARDRNPPGRAGTAGEAYLRRPGFAEGADRYRKAVGAEQRSRPLWPPSLCPCD